MKEAVSDLRGQQVGGRTKKSIKWEVRQRGKSQGRQRADGSRRKENKMSGKPPGARRVVRAMGQGDANRDGGRYQQLDQKSQATWGYPKRGGMYWQLPRNPNCSRFTRLERKTKGRRNETLTTSTEGSRNERLEISFTRMRLKWKRRASSPDIFLFRISGLTVLLFIFHRDHRVIISESCELILFFKTVERFNISATVTTNTWLLMDTKRKASTTEALLTELNQLTSAPAGYPCNVLDARPVRAHSPEEP